MKKASILILFILMYMFSASQEHETTPDHSPHFIKIRKALQEAGDRFQDAGNRLQGTGNRLQGAGNRLQGAGNRFQGAGDRLQGAGNRFQDAGNRLQDSRSELPIPSSQYPSSQYPSPQYPSPQYPSSLLPCFSIRENILSIPEVALPGRNRSGDTLYIGITSGEVYQITGTWFFPGTIVLLNNGILRFRNAEATILGNIIAFGDSRMESDSSVLHFPQEFFYQRSLFFLENSVATICNTTLDFGGLVHNIAVAQNASLLLEHVTKPDFSTVGLYMGGEITINDIDLAGEFIMQDNGRLSISNAGTVLVWHQFDENAVIDFIFPDGMQVGAYVFDTLQSGVQGVDYQVLLSNCTDVMWGLMPSKGSDVTIRQSDLRTIGLWFVDNDENAVSGFVNNTFYQDFTAPLSDRNLHLQDCNVQTWSIYAFDQAVLDITGCMLGEVGTMGSSSVNGRTFTVDGTGGYVFVSDTSLFISVFTPFISSLRTSGNSVALYAYSSLVNGTITALNNSILILVQSSFPGVPEPRDHAVIWNTNITGPDKGIVNSTVDITGSIWIDKGMGSTLMDFSHYDVYYNTASDTSWKLISAYNTNEIRNGIIASWNTSGLETGSYQIKTDLFDDQGFYVSCTAPVILLPEYMSAGEISEDDLILFPNPVHDRLIIHFRKPVDDRAMVYLTDAGGKMVKYVGKYDRQTTIIIECGDLSKGIYYILIDSGREKIIRKFIFAG